MEMTLGNSINNVTSITRIEALKTLTKLLLREVETLADVSLPKNSSVGMNLNLTDKVQNYEINLICQALLEAKGNQRKAAKLLGTKTTTLHAKIKRYDIDLLPGFGKFVNEQR